jgi:hypothetical protein
MDHKNFGQLNVKPLVDDLVQKLDDASARLQREGQEAAESIGDGWDAGIDDVVEKIKASSIKTDKAFKNLSEKIRKQVQQLSTNIGGKDTKIKIDFSDVDINSDAIKKKIEGKVSSIKMSDLIDFDTKNFDSQLTNFVTLFMKYQEKLKSLQQAYPNITVPKDAQNNLQQQLVLATELDKMFRLLNGHGALFTGINLGSLQKDVSKLQQFSDGIATKSVGEYDELAKVLNEIQSSLKVISDTFKNENNSMKSMAESGVTSFESLSQAIVGVYNNLTQVQSLVDNISKKDFNITNVTNTAPVSAPTSKRQNVKQLKAEVEAEMQHVKTLYAEIDNLLAQLQGRKMNAEFFQLSNILSELDAPIYENFEETMLGQMADAKTKVKIENLLVVLDGYIDKLTAINKMRSQFGLDEWRDPFAKTPQPTVKPIVQSTTQVTETPTITQPQNTVATTNTEAQQMWQLKAAIDEVSNAIGRKNAGFIKEQEIVDASVEAEKAKLKELVGVITNEIGLALDDIKAKFAQSLVVPELDKNNLQVSFDEIYNKFVELKDKIGTMQIDIGIDTANITTAIQEALYAKEIANNYQQVEFKDVFESRFGNGAWTNKLIGEVFNTFDEAIEEFNTFFAGLFKSKDGLFLGTKEEMLADILSKQSANITPEQENWAQVIVEAINTQGGKIVESIKLILPKDITNNIDSIDDNKLINAFNTLTKSISQWSAQIGNDPREWFETIQQGLLPEGIDTDAQMALRTLGLVTDSGEATFKIPTIGSINLGTAINDDFVYSTAPDWAISDVYELMQKQNEAYSMGAEVPRILAASQLDDMIFQLQTRVQGVNLWDDEKDSGVFNATNEHIDRLIHTLEVFEKTKLYPDFGGDNILFDPTKGFSIIDLDNEGILGKDYPKEEMLDDIFANIDRMIFGSNEEKSILKDRIQYRFNLPPEQRLVNANTIAIEQSKSEVKITPTMDKGAVAEEVKENLQETPVEAKIVPIADGASNTEQAIDGEAQSATDAAKQFIDAANAKKQFVEANKQVAEGAKESAKAVKEEAKAAEQAKQTMTAVADDTVQPSNWDRVAQLQTDHGEDPFALSRSRTENVGNKSVRTIVESWGPVKDEDGKLTGELELNTVKIINDYKKRTDAITKENEKIKTAKAYLKKFLTQFDNKTMGEGSKLKGYEDLVSLSKNDKFNIDDIARAEQMMSNLDAEYNKVVQSMRKGSSSMNPFVNAINGIDKMEDVLRSISLQFRTLDQQPDWLKEDIINLYKQLDDVTAEADIYAFAEGFGNLKVSINSVVESIRQQRTEQKLALSDFKALVKATKTRDTNTEKAAKEEDGTAWKTYYTDRAAEQQKIVDAIRIGLTLTEEQETQLNAMAEKHALILRDINLENTKVEEQKQKYEEIMSLLEKNHANQVGLNSGALKVVDKDAYQKRLDDERTQIDALIKDADLNPQQAKSVEQFVKLIASLKVESSNIDLMSKKWMEQNILTDEAKAKIEALKQSLLQVTSGTELDLWKKQWKELTNEMSMANIDAKEDKSIGKLIEKDRIAKVKKYIDLLKLQYDYEKKAAKEDDGSKMQSFYNKQIDKVKDKLQETDIQALENQEEKNKRLALEEEKQRAIAEIQAQREKAQQKKQDKEAEKQLFVPQDKKIQDRFDAGYLNKGQYDNWQRELVEYQSYMKGVTQADEATIANKRQSLMQLYDTLVKTSNASKAFFASGGEILPKEMWLDKSQIDDTSKSLTALYNNIATERFEGMKTSITGVNDKLGKLNFVVDDGQGSLTQYTIALDKASGATKLLQNNTKPALTVLQKFGQSLKKDFTGLLTAVMGGTSIHTFVQYMRQGVQSVRELDLALTELKKVTDATEETYDKFLDTAASTSARIGSTLSNMTSATAEFAKLGYDIATAASMAESALVYTNVGDNVDVETGSQSIISTLKAFGIEANNTMSIVDKFNEIGNNFAITTAGIGDALQVSASAMAAAGNTLDETIALTAAANTIVQNPNTVGRNAVPTLKWLKTRKLLRRTISWVRFVTKLHIPVTTTVI